MDEFDQAASIASTEIDEASLFEGDVPFDGSQPDIEAEDDIRISNRQSADRDHVNRQQQKAKDKAMNGRIGYDSVFKHPARWGLYNRGNHIAMKAAGKMGPGGVKQVTPDQLRAMLVEAIVGHGWTEELSFYKGYKYDGQLANQAEAMLATDAPLQKILQNHGITQMPRVQKSISETPPEWCDTDSKRAAHEREFYTSKIRSLKGDIEAFDKKTIGKDSVDGAVADVANGRDETIQQLRQMQLASGIWSEVATAKTCMACSSAFDAVAGMLPFGRGNDVADTAEAGTQHQHHNQGPPV